MLPAHGRWPHHSCCLQEATPRYSLEVLCRTQGGVGAIVSPVVTSGKLCFVVHLRAYLDRMRFWAIQTSAKGERTRGEGWTPPMIHATQIGTQEPQTSTNFLLIHKTHALPLSVVVLVTQISLSPLTLPQSHSYGIGQVRRYACATEKGTTRCPRAH